MWPNPSRDGSASIALSLPTQGRAKLAIYDMAGRHVRTVVDKDFTPGRHVVAWDGRAASGAEMSAGVYVVRMTTAQGMITRRFVIAP